MILLLVFTGAESLTNAAPSINRESGFFNMSPDSVSITLTASNTVDTLHYTTDGSKPSDTNGTHIPPVGGNPATTTFSVNETTVLRVRQGTEFQVYTVSLIDPWDVFGQSKPSGADPDLPNSYFDLDEDAIAGVDLDESLEIEDYEAVVQALAQVPSVSIATNSDHLFQDNDGILSFDGSNYANPDVEYEASFEWIEPDPASIYNISNTKRVQKDFTLSHHGGNVSIGGQKQSLKVNFNVNGDLDLSEEGITAWNLFSEGSTDEYDELTLRNPHGDSFALSDSTLDMVDDAGFLPCYARNPWAIKTMNAMVDLHPRTRLVHVYLNGMYWGIYWMTEMPNEEYMQNNTGINDDEFVELNEGTEPNDPSPAEEWFYDNRWLGAQNQDNYDLAWNGSTFVPGVSDMVDLDQYIDYMIMSAVMNTGDGWPGRQYRAIGQLPDDYTVFDDSFDPPAQIKFFSWDQDFSMVLANAIDDDVAANYDLVQHDDHDVSAIIVNMKNDTNFRDDFAARLNLHCRGAGALSAANSVSRWDSIKAELESVIAAEYARWGRTEVTLSTLGTVTDLEIFYECFDDVDASAYFDDLRLFYVFDGFVSYLSLTDKDDIDSDMNTSEPLPNPYSGP